MLQDWDDPCANPCADLLMQAHQEDISTTGSSEELHITKPTVPGAAPSFKGERSSRSDWGADPNLEKTGPGCGG